MQIFFCTAMHVIFSDTHSMIWSHNGIVTNQTQPRTNSAQWEPCEIQSSARQTYNCSGNHCGGNLSEGPPGQQHRGKPYECWGIRQTLLSVCQRWQGDHQTWLAPFQTQPSTRASKVSHLATRLARLAPTKLNLAWPAGINQQIHCSNFNKPNRAPTEAGFVPAQRKSALLPAKPARGPPTWLDTLQTLPQSNQWATIANCPRSRAGVSWLLILYSIEPLQTKHSLSWSKSQTVAQGAEIRLCQLVVDNVIFSKSEQNLDRSRSSLTHNLTLMCFWLCQRFWLYDCG